MSLKKMMLVPLRFIEVGNDPSEISFGVLQAEFHGAGRVNWIFLLCLPFPAEKLKGQSAYDGKNGAVRRARTHG